MKKKLTLKQKRFITYFKQTPSNIALAARKAGYRDRNAGYEAMQNHAIRTEVEQFINKVNGSIPDDAIIKQLKAGLSAKKADCADHQTRLAYLDLILKFKTGQLINPKYEPPQNLTQQNVIIRYEDPETGKSHPHSYLRPRIYNPGLDPKESKE